METIKDNGRIVAIVYRDADWIEGLNFITPGELNIQVSSWHYQEGKKLASHIHKDYERVVSRTHEMTYVKQGSMKVLLYDEARKPIGELVLFAGDLAVYAYGGHGYQILENNTQIVEAKTGPFIDVSHDKVKFE